MSHHAPKIAAPIPLRTLQPWGSIEMPRKIDANASHAIECYPHCEMHELLLIKPVAVAMLILANAYFVAVEFALISIRDTRVEQLLAARVPGARAVRSLQSNLDDLLPAVQLGVTLCSLALG